MKTFKKILRILLYITLLWLLIFVIVNFKPIIELSRFLIEYRNYKYLSNDSIPKKSEYGYLYDFVKLGIKPDSVPSEFVTGINNYHRMDFILKKLDSMRVDYDTIYVPNRKGRPIHTCNIFVKECRSDTFTLITAHYDNLIRHNYEGALDNSASVAILLNVIKNTKRVLPEKNIAFLFTTWEEQGLIGAKAFFDYAKEKRLKINKVICLDGVGRGDICVMNNSMGSFGFKFRNWYFKEMIFTGSEFKNCPQYSTIDKSVVDLKKYNIKVLTPFLSSTDSRIFVKSGIPTIDLTSGEIIHFLKVMHFQSDKVECLHYKTLQKGERILTEFIMNDE